MSSQFVTDAAIIWLCQHLHFNIQNVTALLEFQMFIIFLIIFLRETSCQDCCQEILVQYTWLDCYIMDNIISAFQVSGPGSLSGEYTNLAPATSPHPHLSDPPPCSDGCMYTREGDDDTYCLGYYDFQCNLGKIEKILRLIWFNI